MICGWFRNLELTRAHVLSFILWQLTQICAAQAIFSIFFNLTPSFRFSSDSNWLTKDDCNSSIEYDWSNASFQTPFVSAAQEFLLICGSRAYYAYLISTLQFVGVLLGAILYGQIADSWGRRKTGIVILILGGISTAAGGSSVSWLMLAICRFLVGTSIGGSLVVVFAYVVEIIEPQQRMFLRSFFNWGWSRLAVTLVCLLFPNWRTASYIFGAIHILPLLLLIFVFPESPKWLICKGRHREALQALERISHINHADLRDCDRCELDDLTMSQHRPCASARIYTIKDLFVKQEIVKTITFFCMWFTSAMSTYTNDLNSRNLKGPFYLIQFMFCFIIGFSKPMLFVIDQLFPKFNRRLLHQLPTIVSIVVLLAVVIVMATVPSESATIPTLVLALLGSVFMEYTFDACYLCTAEGYPTVIRTIGLGACSVAARIGAIVAPQVAFLSSFWVPAPFLAMAFINICNLMVSCRFLPDTKGKQLEDNIYEEVQDEGTEMEPFQKKRSV